MSVRSAIAGKLAPDVHRLAPNANRSFVHSTLTKALEGVGPLPPATKGADKMLAEADGDVDKAIDKVIANHVKWSAAQGFVTNLGGLVTMAATVPVNISGLALLQCRMVAQIAYLRGYDLTDPRVRNAVLLTMLGPDEVAALVKKKKVPGGPMALATAPAYDETLDSVIAGAVTNALTVRVIGKRAAKTIARRVPVAGGVYGAGADGWSTRGIGKYAVKELARRGR